ncbi:MAG: SurA N-terminal domain-containing protein [Sterolibacteriaceae bacterium]|uniref:Periplasmic chaperone PpiD n=1 Tax=Candidatus Methylophosphatis roskildensis TaxID=2899263 RepID=A0A9D7HUF4_9PROT|nr:SurA N-terminal domain-containing protein [Candidatus Methylophosphatis roskildensis]
MFDSVRNNKLVVQVILGLITLTFAFFGIEAYMRSPGTTQEVAKVGKSRISLGDFQQAMRAQEERMREALGGQFDPKMLDTPEARRAVLDSLIGQRTLGLEAASARLGVSDEQLRDFIASAPALQESGQFSQAKYDAVVRSRGMSREGFEYTLRQDLVQQQLTGAIIESGYASRALAERWVALQSEEREFAEVQFKPEQYLTQVKLEADAIQKFYDANKPQFDTPEQVKVEYVIFDVAAMLPLVTIDDAELDKRYKEEVVSKQEALAQAKRKAESVLAEVRKTSQFGELAKKYSDDPGSAKNGGDLDFFGRGAMVKPFEDAVFAMKEGEVRGPVESSFGFHIIKLTGIRSDKDGEQRRASHILIAKPQGEMGNLPTRDEFVQKARRQAAEKKYAEAAEQFSNLVYEQSDSLKPAMDKFKLVAQTTDWISKTGQGAGKLSNPKLLAALFGDDAIKNKRNTEAVEIAPSTLVSARVLEHKPAALRPLDEVRGDIEKRLTREEAGKLATQDASAKLEKLKKGEAVDTAWGQARKITRSGAPGMTPEALRALFKVPADKLPAYAMSESPATGATIFKISGVNKPQVKPDDPRLKSAQTQLAQLAAGEELNAYLAALRARYKVQINMAALESRQP